MKAGDTLTLKATVRAAYPEWVELDIASPAGSPEPVAAIRLPKGFLEKPEETGADMSELASKPSTGKARKLPNHDKA